MKFTNIAACSAALLSTSALARSTVTVTEYTCTSTSSLARNTVTSTITVYCPPSSDGPVPTATDAPTDVAPTDVAPTGTDVSPTDVAPTGSAPTDDAPTSAAPTDDAPTDVPVPSDTPDTTYPIKGNTVNCRSGPGTNYPIKKTYAKGTLVTITCQTPGTSIYGNAIWDLTGDGCYVTDYYIKTGTSKYIKPKCDVSTIPDAPAAPAPTQGTGGGSGNAGPMKNDYPYGASTCGDVDKWYYYACQCTSFVAWRINERLGINFHNKYKGAAWGNANSWDEAARATGFKVDGNPVPGCIAQSNAGSAGHVAWVSAVNGDTVTIEEYNYVGVEKYSTRTLPVSSFNYIHLKY